MNPLRTIKRSVNWLRGEAHVSGIVLPIDRSVLSPHMELTLAAGRYERRERALSARIVRPGDVVLELGAGLGFLSSYLRKFTGAGKIVCVEANPNLIPYINRVHAVNAIDRIELLNGVVLPRPDGAASIPFYCRRDFWASSLDPSSPFESVVSVGALSFPDILDRHRPDVLVMDIEGGELELLTTPSAGSIRAAVVETHPGHYGPDGLRAIEANFARLGFVEDAAGMDRDVRTFVRAD
jgi:FkbM family methyltransferase